MVEAADMPRDLSSLVVRCRGSLENTADPFEPYRLVDAAGGVVGAVAGYLRDLQAAGRSPATQRSYGMDLLRWFRFLWAVDVGWDRATQLEARDFCCWIQGSDKAVRPHWRQVGQDPASGVSRTAGPGPAGVRRPGVPNAVTGKPTPGLKYASSTVAHCETVLRSFYAFHLEAGSGPMVNPFPLVRGRRAGRANAHGNPMDPVRAQRSGRYRPRVPVRIPRAIPDEKFDELFAALGSHRDRALVAFWVSTGARAAELLGATNADADPGQQLITVIRKGSRCLQQLPASPDAFVWLRLYQAQLQGVAPPGADQPLWWTLRKPLRALAYHAARAMFGRANALLGSNWSLHDLRHSAAYRMARDPLMTLTDVQWVLGHAHLSTTQVYLTAPVEDMIAAVVAHHARRAQPPGSPPADADRLRYRQQSLDVLFGQGSA
jgi:site-specific recombinase XerC